MPFSAADISNLLKAYTNAPALDDPAQAVIFGTSGHRGSSLAGSFNEAHILAITQAVCDYRKSQGVTGPLFMGKDTHALSDPAHETALEVLAANHVSVLIQEAGLPSPTPVISRAVLSFNMEEGLHPADGIVITPSHNPPTDGGFKYNESHGGPAGAAVTAWIEKRAGELLRAGNRDVRRMTRPRASSFVREADFIGPYVRDLAAAVNLRAVAESGLRLGVDPLGGASLPYWDAVARIHKLNLAVVNKELDPAFAFMPPDHDGKVRMDCSSACAMANLVGMKDSFDLAFGCDPDADRHGIVTPQGLMSPNNYLAAVVWYLLRHRRNWPAGAKVGKTAVTTGLLDRIASDAGREVCETPVGFKWFVPGLASGGLLFGGEESAGASFLRMNGTPWTTDKDGILLCLAAAELTAVTGKNPSELYAELTEQYGSSFYARIDAPADMERKRRFKNLLPESVTRKDLAGRAITRILTVAPGNNESIGGLKVETESGWFAARPSGTEDLYKIYAESFESPEHLARIQEEAQDFVDKIPSTPA